MDENAWVGCVEGAMIGTCVRRVLGGCGGSWRVAWAWSVVEDLGVELGVWLYACTGKETACVRRRCVRCVRGCVEDVCVG